MSHDSLSRVLVVDDDQDITECFSTCFHHAGYQVRTADSGEEALRVAAEFVPQVVFLDILIPEQDGWLVCSKLKLHSVSPAIVLMTGKRESNSKRFAEFVHADAFLEKPFAASDALQRLRAIANSELQNL